MSDADFEARIGPHRDELRAHCYRLLGSVQDADDALQEALLGAWRGLEGFQGRSSLRSWLYRIATNACLRLIAERPKRLVSVDFGSCAQGLDLDAAVREPVWLEPYPLNAEASYAERESVELAFVAALQHLPATQRAVLVLREVLGFEATEVAEHLALSVAAVNGALQRARRSLEERMPTETQQATLRALGDTGARELLLAFMDAWQRSDIDALVALFAEDVRFSMPPIPTWFDGREAVAAFFEKRVFSVPWRLVPTMASGQLALACYQGPEFRPSALNVITVRGRLIVESTGFLNPAVHRHFFPPDR